MGGSHAHTLVRGQNIPSDRRAAPHAACSNSSAEKIGKLITFLYNQRDRFGYNDFKEEGLPIGSGGIESANKYINHARLKRSGACWITENGNNMLR